jgi:nitrate/TMAO reductase-like tetraheme cytochrome c subunit
MSRKVLLGTTVGASLFFMIVGVIFWGGFNTAMEATNTLEFCISCHEMEENVYREYTETIHYNNPAGVRATCSDCHVPRPWVHKVVRKIQATNELFHKALGSIDTPEKFDAKRLTLARNVWRTMKATDSRECRNCHDFTTMDPEKQQPRARKQHMNAMEAGNTCIDCHKGIAHKKAHDQLDDEELEQLEAPDPSLAIALPPQWQAFVDKQLAEKSAPLAVASVTAPTSTPAPEAAAPVVEVAKAPVAARPAATKPAGAAMLDWSKVPAREVVIFYPGQGSMEWMLRGKDHGGARPFKAGDRCFDCHDEEAADMGDKIVNGEKLEPNVIPNKRGSIPVAVQAAHDGTNLYLRFAWPQGEHVPVPFADGGKMDPANPMKLALMLASDEVEYADRAGCWGTCHADAKSMPFEPQGTEVTKYLKESRTKIETRGRDNKPLGGWDKRKSEDEIRAELEAGHIMDLIRYKSGKGEVEDGYILADRVMEGGQGAEFAARQEGKQWVVEMKRKLNSDKAGDINLALDQLYNFGFAIHDDYSNARYHHVSLGYKLGFDNPDAEINAIKK